MSYPEIFKMFPTITEDDIKEAININGKKVLFYVDNGPERIEDGSSNCLALSFYAIDVDTDNILCTEQIKFLDLIKQVKDQDGYRILKRDIYSRFIEKLKHQ